VRQKALGRLYELFLLLEHACTTLESSPKRARYLSRLATGRRHPHSYLDCFKRRSLSASVPSNIAQGLCPTLRRSVSNHALLDGWRVRANSAHPVRARMLSMPIVAKEEMYRISTDETVDCPVCEFIVYSGSSVAFSDVCNHILQVHKLKCLHVGQETTSGGNGEPRHHTVAVFGK